MPLDKFMIVPFESGLQTNVRPFLIMDDSFEVLENAYVYRGRLRKRFGSRYTGYGWDASNVAQLFSRLRVQVGTIGSPVSPVPAGLFLRGQQISAGDQIFTIWQLGTPASMLATGPGTGTANTSTGAFTLSGTGLASNTPIWWYPNNPVMGIATYQLGSPENEPTYAFDTQYAYLYANGYWQRSTAGSSDPVWHGDNLNFFDTAMWLGVTSAQVAMFVTNFNATVGAPQATDDPLWSFSNTYFIGNTSGGGTASGTAPGDIWEIGQTFLVGTQWFTVTASSGALTTAGPGSGTFNTVTGAYTFTGVGANVSIYFNTAAGIWSPFYPYTNPGGGAPQTGPYVASCRLIIAFRNRLLLLNTVENNGGPDGGANQQYVARCRFSANSSPFVTNAWYEINVTDNAGNSTSSFAGGGYIDAYTDEAIIACEFIKDRLIVFFERSTYELAYTGNELQPFLWQKINTELGSESPLSTIPFDKQVLTIGNVGVHACNGANVDRIDTKIPQNVFSISLSGNDNLRVQGVRDYFPELAYWTYCSTNSPSQFVYPNKILLYNYQNQSWAVIDDCITAFGYIEQQPALTWAEIEDTWENFDEEWQSGSLGYDSRRVVAGNQQGYVFFIDVDSTRNAGVMQITQIVQANGFTYLQVYANTLAAGDYIQVQNCQGTNFANINTQIVPVISNVGYNTSTHMEFSSADWIKVQFVPNATLTYTGGGTVARVSNYNILSKQWNPYITDNQNVHLQRIEFGVEATAKGQVTVDYYPSATEISMLQAGTDTGAIMGSGILETSPYSAVYYPLEQFQKRLWHSVYFQSTGECIQINIYMSDVQMRNPSISLADFQCDGMTIICQPSSSRLE